MEKYLSIGEVLKPQGLNGLVKIRPDTDDPNRFLELDHIFYKTKDQYLSISVSSIRVNQGFVYLVLGQDATADDAEKWRGVTLFINREAAVPLAPNQNYISDLIGCEVWDSEGNRIGLLKNVLQPGANDVYELTTPSHRTILVPALLDVVIQVDIANRRIVLSAMRYPEVSVFEN